MSNARLLAEHYARGELVAANALMCMMVEKGEEIPAALSESIRSQFRVVDELKPGVKIAQGDTGWSKHGVFTTHSLDVYDNMHACFRRTVESECIEVSFDTEYEWSDIRDALWTHEALHLVFPECVQEVTLIADETETTKVLHVLLKGGLASAMQPYGMVVRVCSLHDAAEYGKHARAVLVLQEISTQKEYAGYVDKVKQAPVAPFSCAVYVEDGINERHVSVCMRQAAASSRFSFLLQPFVSYMWRAALLSAVHAWLVVASKLYHGDKTVANVQALVKKNRSDGACGAGLHAGR